MNAAVKGHPNRIVRWLAWLAFIGAVALWLAAPSLFPGNSELYDAIGQGDEAAARRLLEAGADPNSRWQGMTHQTARRLQRDPLTHALHNNQPGIARLLLESGADPNARDRYGKPALIEAANSGMVELVQTLIQKGADVRAATPSGETALHYGRALSHHPKDLHPAIKAMLERAGAR